MVAARDHFRRAATGGDEAARRMAQEALAGPASAAERRSLQLLARVRRLREAGRESEAEELCVEAFRAFPASAEARLCAARESLRAGRSESARALASAVLAADSPSWLRPDAHLVRADALEQSGATHEALAEYRRVLAEPGVRDQPRSAAEAAIRRLRGEERPSDPPLRPH
jgi:hypothetical protein